MNRIIYILIVLYFAAYNANAQQLQSDNQYLMNKFALSQAYAGTTDNIEVFLGYRNSWLGVAGAPQKQILNGNAPITGKNMGLGVNFINEKTGNINHFYFSPSYAYHMNLSADMQLHFGIAAEIYRNQLANIVSSTIDPYLYNYQSIKGTSYNASAAVVFQYKTIHIGLSTPRMLNTKIVYNSENQSNTFTLKRHYQAFASYSRPFKTKWMLDANFIARSTDNSPFQFEATVLTRYDERLWAGVGYRKGNNIGFSVGAALNKKIVMNYTYEFATAGISNYSSGTHEISLGFMVRKSKLEKAPPTIFRLAEDEEMPKIDPELENKVKLLESQLAQCDCKSKDEVIAELDKRLKKLEGSLDQIDADLWEKPFVIDNIKFGHNSDKLFASSYPELNKLADKLNKNPDWSIKIVGYTDNQGSPAYNKRLSEKRAVAVKEYLMTQGIEAQRIIAEGLGMDNPIGDNNTNEGRALNRRIEGSFKKK